MFDLSPHADKVRLLLDALHLQARELASAIRDEDHFIFVHEHGIPVEDAIAARQILCNHLTDWDYPVEPVGVRDVLDDPYDIREPDTLDSVEPAFIGTVAVSNDTLAIARELNAQKLKWALLHGELRKLFGGGLESNKMVKKLAKEAEATDHMRMLLKLAGWGRLNLDASDRLVPVLDGPALSINWFKHASAPSKQSTLGRVIDALESLVDQNEDWRADLARADLDRLADLPLDTPVAYRAKSACERIRYRAIVNIHGQRSESIAGNARNPILYPCGGGKPKLVALKSKRRAGAGRPINISDERVSHVVPYLYWYIKPPTNKGDESPVVSKTHNPFASTLFPGMWLGTRAVKQGFSVRVMVKVGDRAATSASVGRLGLAGAWAKAARLYANHHGIPLDDVLKAQPSESQVEQLLVWVKGIENTPADKTDDKTCL